VSTLQPWPHHFNRRGVPQFPAQPLAEALDRWRITIGIGWSKKDQVRFEELSGVTVRQYFRWKAGGNVQGALADEVCIRIGIHPAQVWPEWLTAGIEEGRDPLHGLELRRA
jgi:hypothetical protein